MFMGCGCVRGNAFPFLGVAEEIVLLLWYLLFTWTLLSFAIYSQELIRLFYHLLPFCSEFGLANGRLVLPKVESIFQLALLYRPNFLRTAYSNIRIRSPSEPAVYMGENQGTSLQSYGIWESHDGIFHFFEPCIRAIQFKSVQSIDMSWQSAVPYCDGSLQATSWAMWGSKMIRECKNSRKVTVRIHSSDNYASMADIFNVHPVTPSYNPSPSKEKYTQS